MTRLVPMRPETFAAFVEEAVAAYDEDNVGSGRWPPHDALELARAELRKLLPDGIGTPQQQFFEIVDEAAGGTVGYLWPATMKHSRTRTASVYQVVVRPGHRRRGHARAALQQAAALAAAQGHDSIALHVFSHNGAAQALYRPLGYRVAGLNMAKRLQAASAGTWGDC
jgi:ribosomal protein S18 acetylase RimI-like enzyme